MFRTCTVVQPSHFLLVFEVGLFAVKDASKWAIRETLVPVESLINQSTFKFPLCLVEFFLEILVFFFYSTHNFVAIRNVYFSISFISSSRMSQIFFKRASLILPDSKSSFLFPETSADLKLLSTFESSIIHLFT